MPKYKYEIRYTIGGSGSSYFNHEIGADTWEYDLDDQTFNFVVKDGEDKRTVFSIRTCHVVYVREVGIVEAAESGS